MFELEEYSTGFHDGFLNKYADSSGPTLDFYISDSLQDMLDIDIRSEVANVVGSVSDYENCMRDLPSLGEHGADSLPLNSSSVVKECGTSNNSIWNSTSAFGIGSSNSSSSWFGANSDFLADVGACVNPISVMPLISSSLIHMSPKTNLNANILRSNSPPPASPNVNDTKSHLTFSPAHMKISANSIRNEQIISHIPKQVVPISSSVTSGTTAPATLATNSALQRKNAAVEAIRKDLGADLKKVIPLSSSSENVLFKTTSTLNGNNNLSKTNISNFSGNNSSIHQSNNSSSNSGSNSSITTVQNNKNISNTGLFNSGSTSSSTIKLGPGIGGLTFANNITYNKLKQQSNAKTSTLATITANGTIVLKRDRESSPMQGLSSLNNAPNNGQHVTKILSRNSVHSSSSFTPKSIASSAHHNPHTQQQLQNISSGTSMISNTNHSISNGNGNHTSVSVNSTVNTSLSSGSVYCSSGISSNNTGSNIIAVKSIHQKIKATPIESEFPKPAYSYSCLIAMALKNSRRGSLPVSEIYSFMCEHFPYFKTAPSGWKNSVRHNLSLNKCFEKIEKPPTNGNQRKGCLWAMNPERIAKMDEEVQKWSRKDPMAIRNAMVYPENLEALERGEMKHGSSGDSDTEMDSQSEIEETSDMEEQELDETLVDNMLVEEDVDDDINNATTHPEDDNDDNEVSEAVDRNSLRTTNSSSPLSATTTKVKTSNIPVSCTPTNMHRDFDIEVEDIYDAIDIDDDKEAVRMAISQSDIIELSPADYNITGDSHQSPKRARLNVNYSIGSAGEIETQFQNQNQHQVQIQNIKKIVKVQNVHDLQHIQHQLQQKQQLQQQQQILLQTISSNNSVTSQLTHQGNTQYSQISSLSSTLTENLNRRKMQLVNRIS